MANLYGWRSEKQFQAAGHGFIYQHHRFGVDVDVTLVTPTMSHGTTWDDIKFVGRVTHKVGDIYPSKFVGRALADAKLKEMINTMPIFKDEVEGDVTIEAVPETPKLCPLGYYGTGECTCGEHRKPRREKHNRNAFGYETVDD